MKGRNFPVRFFQQQIKLHCGAGNYHGRILFRRKTMKRREAYIRVSMAPARGKEEWLAVTSKVSQETSPPYKLRLDI